MLKKRLFIKFLRSSNGNVLISAVLVFPILLMFSGAAIDYGIIVQSRQALTQAANASALAAVNEAQIAYNNQENINLIQLIEDTAENTFRERISKIKYINVIDLIVTPAQQGGTISATVSYKANYKPMVMNIVGYSEFTLSDRQRAIVSGANYINITLLVDTSSSMGIGATKHDQDLMFNDSGCAFSCHSDGSYQRARFIGATTRIDVARDSIIQSIEAIQENVSFPDQVTMTITGVAGLSQNIVNTESNLDYIKQKVSTNLHLYNSHWGGTDIESRIKSYGTSLPPSGSGRSPNDRVQYLIIITDGVEDMAYSGASLQQKNFPHHPFGFWAIRTDECEIINQKGIKLFFLHTKYLIPEKVSDNLRVSHFAWIDSVLNPIIPSRLQECAGSADRVFETSTPEEIQEALLDMMGGLSTPLRLY